mmetsp:Transcript_29220/g.61659  ORF Transcript_29220/g.61659 Transcript_29220/m.61659 type:complete len:223 (+) Transcript_29220:1604-2272(+)
MHVTDMANEGLTNEGLVLLMFTITTRSCKAKEQTVIMGLEQHCISLSLLGFRRKRIFFSENHTGRFGGSFVAGEALDTMLNHDDLVLENKGVPMLRNSMMTLAQSTGLLCLQQLKVKAVKTEVKVEINHRDAMAAKLMRAKKRMKIKVAMSARIRAEITKTEVKIEVNQRVAVAIATRLKRTKKRKIRVGMTVRLMRRKTTTKISQRKRSRSKAMPTKYPMR